MDFQLVQTYLIKLTPNELRLVCKALGGRLTEDEIEEAKKLDIQIATSRIKNVEHQYNEITKLKDNIESVSDH